MTPLEKIKQAKTILEMIEANHNNNKINAMVWCLCNDVKFSHVLPVTKSKKHPVFKYYGEGKKTQTEASLTVDKQFMSSRDALKSIRPEGWWFRMGTDPNQEHMAGLYNSKTGDEGFMTDEEPMPTEEAAELHAIMQAWIYEWEKE